MTPSCDEPCSCARKHMLPWRAWTENGDGMKLFMQESAERCELGTQETRCTSGEPSGQRSLSEAAGQGCSHVGTVQRLCLGVPQ